MAILNTYDTSAHGRASRRAAPRPSGLPADTSAGLTDAATPHACAGRDDDSAGAALTGSGLASPPARWPSVAKSVSPNPVMVTITVLMAIGVVMVYSALAGVEAPDDDVPLYRLTSVRSMMFAPAAFLVMLAVSYLPYRCLASPAVIALLMSVCIGLLLAVYIPGVGVEKNLRHRWVKVPGVPDQFALGFQPSEIAKFGLVVFLAWSLGRPGADPTRFWTGFLPATVGLGLLAALIAREDLGTGIICLAVGLSLLVVGGCRLWHPMLLVPVIIVGLLTTLDETRRNRILRWRKSDANQQLDIRGKDWQTWNSMLAIANGGVSGQGLGEGVQKLGRLPLKSSDFILAHIIEELGLTGAAAILAIFGLLLFQGGLIMTRAPDRFGQLIAFGITFIFGLQAFIHAGVVTKLLPNKGINLPFISAGGTGLIIMAAAGGLLASVARATLPTGDDTPPDDPTDA